jgi:hypothetical protein
MVVAAWELGRERGDGDGDDRDSCLHRGSDAGGLALSVGHLPVHNYTRFPHGIVCAYLAGACCSCKKDGSHPSIKIVQRLELVPRFIHVWVQLLRLTVKDILTILFSLACGVKQFYFPFPYCWRFLLLVQQRPAWSGRYERDGILWRWGTKSGTLHTLTSLLLNCMIKAKIS